MPCCRGVVFRGGAEFSLVGCSDVPLGFVELLGGSVVVNVGKAVAWEHVRGLGRVAGYPVALLIQRSLVHKYPPQLATRRLGRSLVSRSGFR